MADTGGPALAAEFESDEEPEIEPVSLRAPDEGETLEPVYWHSNAPWVGSGYGSQSALFGPALAELGYDVAFGAFSGLTGRDIPWEDERTGRTFRVYPGGRHAYGNDVIGAHAKRHFAGRGGLVVTLTDPWVLAASIMAKLPTLAWIPVDHEPLMPRTHHWLQLSGAVPLAMSRFGAAMMERNGFSPLYAPHGFDPAIFRNDLDREYARHVLRIPKDTFVVGIVAANLGNPSRKCFSEAFQAFQAFRNKVGRQAILYVHTNMEDPQGQNLVGLCDSLGLTPMRTNPYEYTAGLPPQAVAAAMTAFDVLLNPAQGEGFGITPLEAQACGTPCIVTDFSASREVAPADEGNWNVSGRPEWTDFDAWQLRPDVEEITEALVAAFEESEADRLVRRAQVHAWAHREYTVDHVRDTYWAPVMQDAIARIRWENQKMGRGAA